jgi:hypothetical protein
MQSQLQFHATDYTATPQVAAALARKEFGPGQHESQRVRLVGCIWSGQAHETQFSSVWLPISLFSLARGMQRFLLDLAPEIRRNCPFLQSQPLPVQPLVFPNVGLTCN